MTEPAEAPEEPPTEEELDDWIETITKGDKKTWQKENKLTVKEITRICLYAGLRAKSEDSNVEVAVPAIIFGDVHGQFDSFYTAFVNESVDFDVLRLKERRFLFLGDFVDRGNQSLRTVLLYFCLYLRFPKHMFITRGNHEIRSVNKRYGLYKELQAEWRDDYENLYAAMNNAFSFLPLSARVGTYILAMHGGLSQEIISWESLKKIARPLDEVGKEGLACDLVWSDPVHMIVLCQKALEWIWNKSRNISWKFGEGAVRETCKVLDVDLVVRCHICTNGLVQFCEGCMLTVFSAPGYQDRHNKATVLRVGPDLKVTAAFYKDKSDTLPFSPEEEETVEVGGEEEELNKKKKLEEEELIPKPVQRRTFLERFGFKRQRPMALPAAAMVVSCFLLAYLGYSFSPAPTANTTPYTLNQFSEMSSKLARVVNGMFIGEAARDGSLNRRHLIDEFFSFGADVSLGSLATANVSELAENLNSIKTVVDGKCGGSDGCGVSNKVLDGIDAVSQLQDVVPVLEKALGAAEEKGITMISKMNSLVNGIKSVFKDNSIGTFEEKVQFLIDHASSGTEEYSFAHVAVLTFMDTVSDLFQLLIDSDSLFAEFQGAPIESMKTNLRLISPVKSISERVQQKGHSISPLRSELRSFEKVYQELTTAFDNGDNQTIFTALDHFIKMKHSSRSEKVLTSGFLSGFEDLKRVSADIQDNWLKTLLNPNMNMTALNQSISELDKIYKQFSSLHASFAKVNLTSDAELLAFKTVLSENAQTANELLDLVTVYGKCVGSLDVSPRFDIDVSKSIQTLESAPKHLESLKTSVKSFLTARKADLNTIVNQVVKTIKSPEQLSAKIKEVPDYLNQTVTLFTEIQADLENIDSAPAKLWLSQADVGKVGESAKDFIQKSGLITAMKCFQEKYPFGRLQELNLAAQKLSNLKTGDPTMDSLLNQVTSISNLVVEWEKVPTLSKASKPKRAAGSGLKSISKDLGDISSTVSSMADMLQVESHLNTLIGGSTEIESAIEGIQDQTKKDQLKKIWNPEVVNALKSNQKSAATMSAEVAKMKKIETTADFQTPFESAVNVQNCHVDFRELASSLSGKIGDQKVATSLETLKTLDLEFAKMEKSKVGGVLSDLQSFFNSFFGIDTSKKTGKMTQPCDDGECSTEAPTSAGMSVLAIVLLSVVGGLSLIAAVIIGFFCGKRFWRWLVGLCKKKKPEAETRKGGEYDHHKDANLVVMNRMVEDKKAADPSPEKKDLSKNAKRSGKRSGKGNSKKAGNDQGVEEAEKSHKSKSTSNGTSRAACNLRWDAMEGYDDDAKRKAVEKELNMMGMKEERVKKELQWRHDEVTRHKNLNLYTEHVLKTLPYYSGIFGRRPRVPAPEGIPDRANIRLLRNKDYTPDNHLYDLSNIVVVEYTAEFLNEGKRKNKDASTKTCQSTKTSMQIEDSTKTMKVPTEETLDASGRTNAGGESEEDVEKGVLEVVERIAAEVVGKEISELVELGVPEGVEKEIGDVVQAETPENVEKLFAEFAQNQNRVSGDVEKGIVQNKSTASAPDNFSSSIVSET